MSNGGRGGKQQAARSGNDNVGDLCSSGHLSIQARSVAIDAAWQRWQCQARHGKVSVASVKKAKTIAVWRGREKEREKGAGKGGRGKGTPGATECRIRRAGVALN